jgi:hypothetical protein
VETLQRALEPYRHLDPLGWVGVYRVIPAPVGLLAAALGVLMLLFGGRRLFRLVAGPLGALLATVWAAALATRLGFGAQANKVTIISTFALFGLGLLLPPVVVFFAFGIPAGLLAGQLAGQADWMLGFAPGLMVGGALGVVLQRPVSAVLSSAVGAWVLVLGAMAALDPFVPGVRWLADSPMVALAIAALAALAGVVFQLFVRPSPEQSEKLKVDKGLAKRRAKESAELEKRWSKYGKKE